MKRRAILILFAGLATVTAACVAQPQADEEAGSADAAQTLNSTPPPAEPTNPVLAEERAAEQGVALAPTVGAEAAVAAPVDGSVALDVFEPGVPTPLTPTPVPTELPTPTPTPVPPPPCSQFTLYLSFESGSSLLSAQADEVIADAYAQAILGKPTPARVRVDGHTDSTPYSGAGGNEQLSSDRASAVVERLRALGLPMSVPVEIIGHADRVPVAAGEEPSALARNRRVEVHTYC